MLHGLMGTRYLDRAELDGTAISLHYRQADSYFINDEFVARLSIGAAFGLLYRCALGEVIFHYNREGQDVALHVTKEAFNGFFGLTEQQMTQLASDPDRFDVSPVHQVNESKQWEFYLQFTKD